MTTITLTHHSERFDRPNSRVKRDGVEFRKTSALVTRTEMSGPRVDLLRVPGWSFCQSENRGEDNTHAEWSNALLSLSGMPYSTPLTSKTFFRKNGSEAPPIEALVTFLADAKRPNKRLAIITVHMSLDNTPRRAEVWRDCSKGMKALVAKVRREDPGIKVIIAADFNKNYRQEAERAAIERYFCKPNGLTNAYDHSCPKTGGTIGKNALIDGWLVDEGVKVVWVRLLPDTDGSDHRPVAMRITF